MEVFILMSPLGNPELYKLWTATRWNDTLESCGLKMWTGQRKMSPVRTSQDDRNISGRWQCTDQSRPPSPHTGKSRSRGTEGETVGLGGGQRSDVLRSNCWALKLRIRYKHTPRSRQAGSVLPSRFTAARGWTGRTRTPRCGSCGWPRPGSWRCQ